MLDSIEYYLILNDFSKGEQLMNCLDTSNLSDGQMIRSQVYKIELLRKKGLIEEALKLKNTFVEKGYSIVEQSNSVNGIFYNTCGILVAIKEDPDYDQALNHFHKASNYISIENDASTPLLVKIYDNISKLYIRKKDYLQASKYINQALLVLDQNPEIDDDLRNSVRMSYGSIRSHLGFYDEATQYFESALAYYNSKLNKDLHNIAVLYFNLGNISSNLQNYELAYAQYNQAKELYEALYGPEDYLTIDANSSMASCLILSGKSNQGLEMHQNILDAMELNTSWDTLDYAEKLLWVGADLISIEAFKKALPYIENCIQLVRSFNHDLEKKKIAVLAYSYQTKLLVELGQLKEAKESNNIHNILTYEVYGEEHYGIAYVNYQYGFIAFKEKNKKEALQFFQLALDQFNAQSDPVLYYDNFTVLDIFLKRVELYLEHFREDQNPEWLIKINADIKQSEAIITNFNWDQYSYQSGYRIRNLVSSFNEMKLELTLLQNQDNNHIYRIFEDASSTLLASYIAERNYLNQQKKANLNHSDLRELRILRSYFEQEMKDSNLSSDQRLALTDSVIAIQKRLKQNATHTSNQETDKTPWFSQNAPTLLEIQRVLKDDEGMVQYFCGKDKVYMLKITNDTVIFHSDTIKDLNNQIKKYIGFLNDVECDINSYARKSYYLYRKLLKPLGKLPQKLIFCPHGPLQRLSFESLITSEKQFKGKDWRKLSYLIKLHQIQYTLSGGLWISSNDIQLKKGDFSILYPTYKIDNDTIQNKTLSINPLLFGVNEAKSIFDVVPAKVELYTENEITKEHVLNVFKSSAVVHFIGHAQASMHNLRDSKLILSGNSKYENLYMHEVAVENIPAQLITLSACETSAGMLEKGEGAASLSRAFILSGSKSIISSLWPVNDWSAVPIMTSFYRYWMNGMNKSKSLQQSKLNYLSNCKDVAMAHPFYWSAFVIHGSDEKWIGEPSNKYLWFTAISTILIVLGFFWFVFLRKIKN